MAVANGILMQILLSFFSDVKALYFLVRNAICHSWETISNLTCAAPSLIFVGRRQIPGEEEKTFPGKKIQDSRKRFFIFKLFSIAEWYETFFKPTLRSNNWSKLSNIFFKKKLQA